jgi:superoxide dismutase, Fe-Mn family
MIRKAYLFGSLLLAFGIMAGGCEKSVQSPGEKSAAKAVKRAYEARDFSSLIGMDGFSEVMLQNHFKLYEGYVKNTNLLLDQLRALLLSGNVNSAEYAELKRRLGFEFDGMKLHEIYFSNLGGKKPLDSKLPLYEAIAQNFGNYDLWKKDFVSTGSMRGIGWAVLYVDAQSGRLINFWIDEHQNNHPAGCEPILVMDVWEHAYMLDYNLDRTKYVDAFFNNINWDEAAFRYDQAIAAPQAKVSESLPVLSPSGEPIQMIQNPHE